MKVGPATSLLLVVCSIVTTVSPVQQSPFANPAAVVQHPLSENSPVGAPCFAGQNLADADHLTKDGQSALKISDLAKAEDCYQKALAIREKLAPGSIGMAEDLNGLGNTHALRGELPVAEQYFRQALSIEKKIGATTLALASTLTGMGTIAEQREQYLSAKQFYKQAFALQKRLDWNGLAFAEGLSHIGRIAFWDHQFGRAERNYKLALSIRERLTPGSLDVASSLLDLGRAAFDQDQRSQAKQLYDRGLAIARTVAPNSLFIASFLSYRAPLALERGDLDGVERDEREVLAIQEKLAPEGLEIALTLTRMGDLLDFRGNLDQAEKYYNNALKLRSKLAPNTLGFAWALTKLGVIAEEKGELTRAERYYREALLMRKKLAPKGFAIATSFSQLGGVAYKEGDIEQAARYYRQSMILTRNLAPQSIPLSEAYRNLSRVATMQGQPRTAEFLLRRALSIARRIAPAGLITADVLNALGELLLRQHELLRARTCQLEALKIQQRLNPESPSIAWTLNQLGKIETESGNLIQAEPYLRQALLIQERTIPGGVDQADILAALAAVLKKKDDLDDAAKLYDQALAIFESRVARGSDFHLSFRYSQVYEGYIGLLMRMRQPDRAFEVFERSRARFLLEMLAQARVDMHKNADPGVIQREDALQKQITAKTNLQIRLLNGKHTQDQISTLRDEIETLLNTYKALEQQVRDQDPGYSMLNQPSISNVKTVQQNLLDAGTVLLEYSLGESHSYLWMVDSNSFTSYELPGRSQIEMLARHAYNLLTAPIQVQKSEAAATREARLERLLAQYKHIASKLSRLLLGPVYSQLGNRRLVIVRDGALQYIPFAALPVPESQHITQAPFKPLILEHEIVTLPSISVLAALRQQAIGRKTPPNEVAVLGDPVFSQTDSRVTGTRRTGNTTTSLDEEREVARSARDVGLQLRGQAYLPRLPFSRREAGAIISATPAGKGLKALDFAASRSLAINPELRNYRIIHFATHGLLDNEHPELSGLVFSLVNPRGQPQEGFLDLQDVYQLTLPVDLVVLSACQTALGKEITGEGIVGLTRGFMYAGASRVMASLWRVDDRATAELMDYLYHGIEKERLSPAAALRQAQLSMWRQHRWASPFYWAAFELQGEWE